MLMTQDLHGRTLVRCQPLVNLTMSYHAWIIKRWNPSLTLRITGGSKISSWCVCCVFLCLGAVGVVIVSGCILFFPLWGEGVSGLCNTLPRGLAFCVVCLSGPLMGCRVLEVILFSDSASIPMTLGIKTMGIPEMVVVRV